MGVRTHFVMFQLDIAALYTHARGCSRVGGCQSRAQKKIIFDTHRFMTGRHANLGSSTTIAS
eukprot:296487-Amphidinium_carterae.1